MIKFLLGILTGVVGYSVCEAVAGPNYLKEKIDRWTSDEGKENYLYLNRYWAKKSESENKSEQ